ncbi:MAG: peptide-N-glycosidase [Candidatus Cloacimonadota bacterium]|nr:MAG: peptide-N-glycosidase [Candidatus Cloacimonadota bacterium]PIE80826.1 MAG: peptide-N-glycosidase [Candidatus Delongbacteria bacterium]
MKKLSLLLLVFTSLALSKTYEIKYERLYNGKPIDEKIIINSDDIVLFSKDGDKEKLYADHDEEISVKMLDTGDKIFRVETPFSDFPEPKIEDSDLEILGYKCKKGVYYVFSNKVEIWFTTEADIKGSPWYQNFPQNSLVLKYVVNGNYTAVAKSIEEVEDFKLPEYLEADQETVTEAKYQRMVIDSRYITMNIFDREQVYFDGDFVNEPIDDLSKVYHFSKGTVVMKKVTLPKDYYNYYIFAKLTNWSNGDSYDRVGSLFTFSSKDDTFLKALENGLDKLPVFKANNGKEYQGVMKTGDYYPLIDLMRFYTSFGVSHFNSKSVIDGYNWQDSVVYKQEITELIEDREIWVGVFIGNYDKGGHKVSLELDLYPQYSEEKIERYIEPLFNTVNIMEMSGQNYGTLFKGDTLEVEFNLPENVKNLQLRFTTTGHGGWGSGDEFTKHVNKIVIDGNEIFRIIPWREDSGTYRMSNPASGNFGNGLSSSDLSRSNWSPATLTTPYYIPLYELKSGKHKLKLIIDQGDDEGNMHNSWNVSGVLIGIVED